MSKNFQSFQSNSYSSNNKYHNNSHSNNNSNGYNKKKLNKRKELGTQPQTNHNSNNNASSRHKTPAIIIEKWNDFLEAKVYGSLNYPIPTINDLATEKIDKTSSHFNELPTFPQRHAALLKSGKLGAVFIETLSNNIDESRKARLSNDLEDPAVQIVQSKRSRARVFKLGSLEIDINNLKPTSSNQQPLSSLSTNSIPQPKLVNKLIQNNVLQTPALKRNRDEVVDVSSSIKKNKRMLELQQGTPTADTTMELSFEGKAMDRSDIVKLVDSSVIIPDDSHSENQTYPIGSSHGNNGGVFDTKNLLQNTEFSFEYKY